VQVIKLVLCWKYILFISLKMAGGVSWKLNLFTSLQERTIFPRELLYRPPMENIYIYKREHFLRVWNGAYTLFSISGRTNCVCSVGHRSRRLESWPWWAPLPVLLEERDGGNYFQRFAKGPIDRSADTTSIATKLYWQIQMVDQFIFFDRVIVTVPLEVQIIFSLVNFV
jgi:hypothetical protein